MRKITEQIRQAWIDGKSLAIGKTMTDGRAVYLHGNKIIERKNDGIWFTLAGWNTSTTRERLNGIIDAGVYQRKFRAMRNGVEISAYDWIRV